MNRNVGQFHKETEAYVNTICQAFIAPHEDFLTVECRHKGTEGVSYIKLTDAADTATFFDVTGMKPEDICLLMSKVIVGEETSEMINDYEQRKEIALLFR